MWKRLAVLTVVVALTGCGSGTLGDLGGILGSTGQSNPSDVRGSVAGIDTNDQRIDLNVSTVNNLRSTGGGNSSVYYDSQTRVMYQGRDYRVTDLERGDEVAIRGTNRNGRYVADTIDVVRNVRG